MVSSNKVNDILLYISITNFYNQYICVSFAMSLEQFLDFYHPDNFPSKLQTISNLIYIVC